MLDETITAARFFVADRVPRHGLCAGLSADSQLVGRQRLTVDFRIFRRSRQLQIRGHSVQATARDHPTPVTTPRDDLNARRQMPKTSTGLKTLGVRTPHSSGTTPPR